MDVSGSMDAGRKRMARLFFYWCVQFLRRRYDQTEIVFVAHTTEAREVTEHEFFGARRVRRHARLVGLRGRRGDLKVRYPPADWNVYVLHVSDGDNFTADNRRTLELIRRADRRLLAGRLPGGPPAGARRPPQAVGLLREGGGRARRVRARHRRRREGPVAGAADVLRLRPRGRGRAVTGYALPDLQEIDERCRVIATEDLGFDVPDVVYHLVRPEEVYFAAANGLPARYSSSRWGAQFDQEYGRYQTRPRAHLRAHLQHPARARLPDGRQHPGRADARDRPLPRPRLGVRAQPLAGRRRPRHHAARALGGRADRRLHGRARARPGRGLPRRLPRGRHPPAAGAADREVGGPRARARAPGASTCSSPTRSPPSRARVAEERAALRRRFPRDPEPDLLGFIEHHARSLEDWQRDVISIVHSEQSYFLPQMRTKLLNEGAAVLCHQEICQRLFLPADRYWEYEQLNSGVVQPHAGPGQPVQPRDQPLARDHAHRDRARRRGARALVVGGRRDPFDHVRTVLATTTTSRCCASSSPRRSASARGCTPSSASSRTRRGSG